MGSLADLKPFLERHDYSGAKELLESILTTAQGMERFYALMHLVTPLKQLVLYDEAAQCLEQAEALVDEMGVTLPDQHWLSISMHWENLGYPERVTALRVRLRNRDINAGPFVWMQRRVDYAMGVLRVVERYDVKVLAVGQNCLPDALAIRWGFNTVRVEGPFTAGVFNRDGVAMALEDDFARFHDPKAFKVHPTAAGILSASLAGYYTIFNHELGPWWVEDDCQRIRDLYTRRIDTFLRGMRSDAVLCVCTRINPMNVERLYQGLKARLKPGGRMRLLVLDFLANNPVDPATLTEPDNVRVVPTAYPGPDYVWHMRNHFDTPGGFSFEQVIADAMLDEFLKLRPL